MSIFNQASNKTWLTISDVAELLQVSDRTVRRRIAEGELPAHRIGRQLRIHRKDLDSLLWRGRTSEWLGVL